MPQLTTKELAALEDQIGLEQMLGCKYNDAVQQSTDPTLKTVYKKHADCHNQISNTLLSYLQ